MRTTIQVLEGPDSGRNLVLDGYQSFVMGRARDGIQGTPAILDPYLSRRHFHLEVDGAGGVIRDLGSTNGITWNEERVREAALADGDVVGAGHSVLRFEFEGSADSAAGASRTPARDPVPGEIVGEHELLSWVEPGPPARWHARCARTYRPASLFVLPLRPADDPASAAEAVSALHRGTAVDVPGVARLRDAGRGPEGLWIVTDPLLDPTLDDFAAGPSGRDPAAWIRIGVQILYVLDELHSRDLFHAHLGPGTIRRRREQDGGGVLLAEYGIRGSLLRPGRPRLRAAANLTRDFETMAPERILDARNTGPAADLYAVAATLYAGITGRLPRGADRPPLAEILGRTPPPVSKSRPDAPPALDEFFARALAPELPDRFPDADSMAAALAKIR